MVHGSAAVRVEPRGLAARRLNNIASFIIFRRVKPHFHRSMRFGESSPGSSS